MRANTESRIWARRVAAWLAGLVMLAAAGWAQEKEAPAAPEPEPAANVAEPTPPAEPLEPTPVPDEDLPRWKSLTTRAHLPGLAALHEPPQIADFEGRLWNRPVRGALGIWSLVGLLLLYGAVVAGLVGWSQVLRALAPTRLTRARSMVERRPVACVLMGLVNLIVAVVLMVAVGHHVPPLRLLILLAVVFLTSAGAAAVLESLGVRLSPPTTDDPAFRPSSVAWRGGVALGLTFLIPLLGIVLLMVVLWMSLGAATLSLFAPSTPPMAAAPAEPGTAPPA